MDSPGLTEKEELKLCPCGAVQIMAIENSEGLCNDCLSRRSILRGKPLKFKDLT